MFFLILNFIKGKDFLNKKGKESLTTVYISTKEKVLLIFFKQKSKESLTSVYVSTKGKCFLNKKSKEFLTSAHLQKVSISNIFLKQKR